MPSIGATRSRLGRRHALIAPDSHEAITLPGWRNAQLVHLATPDMGARFSLFLVTAMADFLTGGPLPDHERFVLVREGAVHLSDAQGTRVMQKDDYAFLPAGHEHRLHGDGSASLLVLERPYLPRPETAAPAVFHAALGQRPSAALKGDARLQVTKLLPDGPEWDMEINTMRFDPGASLPYVETHFMEHGLVMLQGGGIYRLEDDWYPVTAGDAIWMGPFCPQWFGAIGSDQACYLIYKNWNRDPGSMVQHMAQRS